MVFLQLELILYFPKIGLKGMEGEFLSIQETVKCPLKSPYRHKHDCKVLDPQGGNQQNDVELTHITYISQS